MVAQGGDDAGFPGQAQDGDGQVAQAGHHALFGQAFLEVQFYPDSVVNTCSSDGGYNVTYAPGKFTVCSPVWQVSTQSGAEDAAFNAELYDGTSKSPLVMSAGDTVRIHFHLGSAGQGWNVTVTDVTTGHCGTIVLNSKYGPLLPLYSTQQIGNALGWGLADDTPNPFVWEIGHTSNFSTPAGQLCYPGQTDCNSYNTASWLGITPLKILSVTFANGSAPSESAGRRRSPRKPIPPIARSPSAPTTQARSSTTSRDRSSRPPCSAAALRTRLHILRHGTEAVAPLIGSNGLPFKATRERQPLPNRPLRIVRQERTTVTPWPRHRRC